MNSLDMILQISGFNNIWQNHMDVNSLMFLCRITTKKNFDASTVCFNVSVFLKDQNQIFLMKEKQLYHLTNLTKQ